MTTTATVPAATLDAIALVGKIVTYCHDQYRVHSVEGPDYYAFDNGGVTTADLGFPRADWLSEPRVLIIPMGRKIGEGYGQEVRMGQVRRGVCLSKAWV